MREDGLVGIREGGRVDGDGFVGRLDGGQFLLSVYLDVPCDYLIFEGRHGVCCLLCSGSLVLCSMNRY